MFGENGLSRPAFDGVPLAPMEELNEALKFIGLPLNGLPPRGEPPSGELAVGVLDRLRVAGEREYRGGVA